MYASHFPRRLGSPPRARGKALKLFLMGLRKGITPACAGKSSPRWYSPGRGWDHPRVRGEKRTTARKSSTASGSPPRARGKAKRNENRSRRSGITPACAGKSCTRSHWASPAQDHPRVRGEKEIRGGYLDQMSGSPPRARGKGLIAPCVHNLLGITPACAGKSETIAMKCSILWDHPRVRGEKADLRRSKHPAQGSPPRARGKVKGILFNIPLFGITPACAGKSQCMW